MLNFTSQSRWVERAHIFHDFSRICARVVRQHRILRVNVGWGLHRAPKQTKQNNFVQNHSADLMLIPRIF
jgi:hypothetical protein